MTHSRAKSLSVITGTDMVMMVIIIIIIHFLQNNTDVFSLIIEMNLVIYIYTLCLEAVHCRIFLQIHDERTLFPSNSVKEVSLLVAHDVVSVADCFVTFRWNIKSDCKS